MSLKKYLSESELAVVQPVTGDAFDISIRELTNIETTVVEHTEGSIVIQLDETAIKLMEEAGITFEDEQLDELAPLIGAVGGALARGVAAGAGALARGAAKAVVGTGLKAAHDKIDKKLFGPKGAEGDYEESVREQDDDAEEDYQPQVGDVVQIDYPTRHAGHFGEVVELSPSGDFVYVQFKDDDIESYHASDLRKATEQEEEEYHYGSDDEFKESINDIRRLSGMKIDELSPAAKQKYVKAATDKGGWFSGPKPGSLAGMKNDMDTVSNYMKKGPEERNYSPRWKNLHKDIQDKYNRRALNVNKVQGQLSRMGESELTERPGDWAPAAAGVLKALAFLIGVPIITAGQIWKSDLPIVDSPLGKAMYDAAARGDKSAEEALKRLDDIGVQRLPMQYIEKLSDKYLHEGKLYENAEYKSIKTALTEAEYQGRKVQLGKPMQGDVKKFKVYVKDPSTGNVKKVNFGDPNMRIKKSNPERRKSFRARHNCDNPGPRTKARYWSCRKW